MIAWRQQVGIWMLLLSCASAQTTSGPASLKNVTADRHGDRVRIEITLSSIVQPAIETANNPSRILIDLPNTTSNDSYKTVLVNDGGVRRIRTGQHSTTPLVTRVVVDLDQSRQYSLETSGNRIVVAIGPAENSSKTQREGPAPAAAGSVLGTLFKRRGKTPSSTQEENTEDASLAAPPPGLTGPAFEPPKENSSAGGTSATSSVAAPNQPVVAPANPQVSPSFDQRQIVVNSAGVTPKTSGSAIPNSPAETQPANPSSTAEVPAISQAPAAPSPAGAAESPVKAETALIARSDDPSLRTVFKVKYVADGVAYLEGGRAQGLSEGMKLEIENTNLPATQGESATTGDPRIVAELVVSGVAETSAVTDIHSPMRPVKVGDLAYLSSGDAAALVQQRTLSATRQYPAVISFTEGDTLDEEARQEVPRPPLPSVNRARGRIGFDDIETISHGTSNITSSDLGMVFRGDITRIGGTYWNLSGYWRGELTKSSAASQQTLQNLLNRTYHLNMTYDNPNSLLVAGFGRLFLPWAPSLDTIDGGYFGRRIGKTTLGIFGGSTPDPSSWDYSPDRVIGGSFVNFEGGEYNGLHFSSTTGAGISMVKWAMDTPFVFLEDSVSYRRDIAVYESAQFDNPKGNSATPAPGSGLGRNFFTLRVNPHQRVELDFNYNYFRQVPTFDPTLVGTGLLDKYLFQGFSAGGRVEVSNQVWLSTNLGRSSGTGDAKSSLNEMYGITFGRVPRLNLRADAHYARFNSSFGTGSYESISLSRRMSDRLRLEALIGQQNFASMITTNTRGRFLTGTVETTLGPHYYLQGNFTTNRGAMSYDQVMFSIGYRFDTRRKGE